MFKLMWSEIISVTAVSLIVFSIYKLVTDSNDPIFGTTPLYIRCIKTVISLLRIINMSILIVMGLFIIEYIQTADMLKATFSEGIKYLFIIGLITELLFGLLKIVLLIIRIKVGMKYEIKYTIQNIDSSESLNVVREENEKVNYNSKKNYKNSEKNDMTDNKVEKSFYDFICELDIQEDKNFNDLIYDIKHDSKFPRSEDKYESVNNYLRCRGADLYFFNIFDILWHRYELMKRSAEDAEKESEMRNDENNNNH